jgi:hypothetical protein
VILALVLACAGEADGPPCEQAGDPALAAAPADVDFGAFEDGDPLAYGTPPQGGAPYSPFHVQATGLVGLDDAAVVTLHAVDPDDSSVLGDIRYDTRFVCANIGESAGSWIGSDLHLRFDGWELDDLDARHAEVTFEVADLEGATVDTTLRGVLTPM